MRNIEVDVQTVHRWMRQGHDDQGQSVALVDCREQNEYDTAKIDDSILMPMRSWPPSPEALAALQDKSVVVHCHHGGRSLRVANWFRQNGFPDATSMAGGIDEWSRAIDNSIPTY
ncbi:MAG: rhodanese-like domain-containing protein, partial [Pirellula sp.]